MKIFKKSLSFMMVVLCIFTAMTLHINAYTTPLDEIQNYTITVNMRSDGTMDIRYHIEWKVLNDSLEGPLEWVKIGNPNKHVDEITSISDNIKSIEYVNDGGYYIRIDFDRAYYEGEIVIFDYSIHQSYMYVLEEDKHVCRYSFTPGWFEELEVKNITIRWEDTNVIESNCHNHEDGYLVWKTSLGMNERLNASVKYNLDAFSTNKEQQYTEDAGISTGEKILIAIVVIIVIILLIALIGAISSDDDYDSHGGFGGGRHSAVFVSSCVRSSCACASCACACACAGGGRAGCSKKDFYKTNLRTEHIKKVLEKKKL